MLIYRSSLKGPVSGSMLDFQSVLSRALKTETLMAVLFAPGNGLCDTIEEAGKGLTQRVQVHL